MLRKDQKILLAQDLNSELTQLKGINSVKYFDENNEEFVEVITEENVIATNIVKMYHTLNLAGLICTEKQDDIEFENTNGKFIKYVDIYYFKFI
jgi:hypothetical protein